MFSRLRTQIKPVLWICLPTLIWSLGLQTVIICIDPLLLPFIEQNVGPRIALMIRWVWVILFLMTVLYGWNISPESYFFFLREALPFTPTLILAALALAIATLIWFASQHDLPQRLGRAGTWMFCAGVGMLVAKTVLATDVMDVPLLRQHVSLAAISNIRMMMEHKRSEEQGGANETPDLTFDYFVRHEKALPSRVVLMVVESWGETRASIADMAGDLSKQGFHIRTYGFTGYRGSTLSGEVRELCAKYIEPSSGLFDKNTELACAPKFLSEKNYEVAGLHGYKKAFYARGSFWERFGVKKQIFRENLGALRECLGPFPAVCDEELIRYGINLLDNADKPLFLYMLTVSSHEPIHPAGLKVHGKYFNEIPVAHPTQVVTRRAISELADRIKGRQHPECTLVYVVGDHQPPTASAKNNIFERGKVPYLVFTDGC